MSRGVQRGRSRVPWWWIGVKGNVQEGVETLDLAGWCIIPSRAKVRYFRFCSKTLTTAFYATLALIPLTTGVIVRPHFHITLTEIIAITHALGYDECLMFKLSTAPYLTCFPIKDFPH